MKTSEGFTVANSTNLPKVDFFMILEFMKESEKYNVAEIRGAKAFVSTRGAYVETAVGYVEVKRERDMCICQCKITPEHRVRGKLYKVIVEIDEREEKIIELKCIDCAAAEGGCKHALCFIMWLNKRFEEPAVTSVACYWNKPKLSEAITSGKIILAQDLGKKNNIQPAPSTSTSLNLFLEECKQRNIKNSLIVNYNLNTDELTDFSLFNLLLEFYGQDANSDFSMFYEFARSKINQDVINKIEMETKNQANSKLWHTMRQGRVTASIIHEATRCMTEDGALVQSVLGGYKVPETVAIKRGKLLEEEVIKEVEKELQIKVKKSGFILVTPIIGASPDGITDNFVVEVKCPLSEKSLKRYIKDNQITQKFKAQVMMQMFAAKKQTALFCVADPKFENNKIVHKYWIDFDPSYTSNLIREAEEFWVKYIYKRLLECIVTE